MENFTNYFIFYQAVASKAPRKNFNAGSSSSGAGASEGGSNSSFNLVNHAKMWPTPKWQKGININFHYLFVGFKIW